MSSCNNNNVADANDSGDICYYDVYLGNTNEPVLLVYSL